MFADVEAPSPTNLPIFKPAKPPFVALFPLEILTVHGRGHALFRFEYLAEIGRRIESASGGDLGEIQPFVLHKLRCRADLDGIEIGNERQSEILIEGAAKMIFGDEEPFCDLFDIGDLAVMLVDITDDLPDPSVGEGHHGVSVRLVCDTEQQSAQTAR